MNANELADWLIAFTQDVADYEEKWIKDSATMLRKQEKELTEAGHMIGVLREYISDLKNGLDSSINLNKAQALRKENQS